MEDSIKIADFENNPTISLPVKEREGRMGYLVGTATMLLALVGLITVFVYGFRLTVTLLDNSDRQRELERLIQPVIMYDPAIFSGVENADPAMVLQSSIWSALMTNGISKYTVDENAATIISVSDIEVAAARLFGPSVQLNHGSFSNFGVLHTYDEENKTYSMAVTNVMEIYTPEIEEISQRGDKLYLTVGYIVPGVNWLDFGKADMQHVIAKRMVYILAKNDKGYYVEGIEEMSSYILGNLG